MNVLRIILASLMSLVVIGVVAYNFAMFFSFFSKRAPYVGTFNYQLKLMKRKLKLKAGKTLVDLGCGDGKAMRFLQKTYNLKYCEGYDLNRVAICRGKLLNLVLRVKKVHIKRKNFLKIDLSKYDYIYLYLLPDQLAKIENWIWETCKKDVVIVTNSFQFAKHKPKKILKNKKGKGVIYLYGI